MGGGEEEKKWRSLRLQDKGITEGRRKEGEGRWRPARQVEQKIDGRRIPSLLGWGWRGRRKEGEREREREREKADHV